MAVSQGLLVDYSRENLSVWLLGWHIIHQLINKIISAETSVVQKTEEN